MAEDFEKKVTLIEVEIDQDAARKEVERLTDSIIEQKDAVKDNNAAIKELEKSNKSLQDEVKKGTKSQEDANSEIVENNKNINQLKKANASLSDGIKDLNKERAKAVKTTKLQSNSLNALRKRSTDLKAALNDQEKATESGADAFEKIQKELKEVNEAIREADQGASDFKTTVGDYPKDLGNATDHFGDFKEGIEGSIASTKLLIKQSLAFLATPLGLFLGAVAAAFLLVKNAMDRNEESGNKVRKVFSAFEGILNLVLKALEPVGEFLIDGLVKGFELAGKAADTAMNLISDGLSALGFDDAAKGVDDFNKAVTEAVVASGELAEAEARLQAAQRESTKIQLEFQKEAEKLRQIRDDESISIENRIKANEELGRVLTKQLEEESKIANLALKNVEERIKMEGETSELLDERAEALTEIADIQERITGQESEQLVNRNSLIKEAKDKEKELADQRQAIADEAAAKEQERIEKEQEQREEATQKRIDQELLLNERLAEIEDIKREEANQRALEDAENEQERFDLELEQEQERFESERERAAERRDILLSDEELSNEEQKAINDTFNFEMEKAEIDHGKKIRDIQKKQDQQEIVDLKKQEAQKKALTQQAATDLQAIKDLGFQVAQNRVQNNSDKQLRILQDQLDSGQITEEQFAAKKERLDKKTAKELHRIQVAEFRVNQLVNLAKVGVNTATSISAAVAASPLTGGLPWSAINAGLGAVQAAAILTEKPPPAPSFEKGGNVSAFLVGGKSHAQGGTMYQGEDGNRFEVEKGEAIFVANKRAAAPSLSLLSGINQQSGGRSFFDTPKSYLENGGGVSTVNMPEEQIRRIVEQTAASLPAPVVEVQSIMAGINEDIEAQSIGVV